MAQYFTWRNCFADVSSAGHPDTVRTFLRDVIWPSIDTLDHQIGMWEKSDDPAAAFVISDLTDLRRSTLEAFCLAIQSLWERQFRAYVATAAREIAPGREVRARSARWDDVLQLFGEVRGIALSDFAQSALLADLQLIGNVCRHGDGLSLAKLTRQRPDLWPGPRELPNFDGQMEPVELSTWNMVIRREDLAGLGDAVIGFWETVDYLYLESLQSKHESVERRLPDLRNQFAKCIKANLGSA